MKRRDFAAEAVQDLNDLHDYIARDGPSAARRFTEMIEDRCSTLSENPMAGRSRAELLPKLRSFQAGGYTIFYFPQEDGVEIVRVIHGARDITTLF